MNEILFWALSVMAVTSALCVVCMRNPANSVMALLVTMFAAAGMFALMEAYVLALFQIIVYIGAILVLFVFVIMLLNLRGPVLSGLSKSNKIFMGVGIALSTGAVWLVWRTLSNSALSAAAGLRPGNSVAAMAIELFSRHLLVFELTSVLLFAAAVGAVYLTRREKESS